MNSWLRYLLFGIGLLLLVWAGCGRNGMLHLKWLNREIGREKRQIEVVEEDNRRLERRVWRLQHDPAFQELTVRRELGMVAPDERVYVLPGKRP
jgi:cell division protein FtsB